MNRMKVEPLGLDDRLPCVVYLPPSLCLGLGTTVRTLLTALAQRRRWVEEGKLRGDLIQVSLDPTEKLAKIRGELAKKDAEIERLRAEITRLRAAQSGFMEVGPLDEDDYEEIATAAAIKMKKFASGVRGQVMTVRDSFGWWVMKETERRIRALAEAAVTAMKGE